MTLALEEIITYFSSISQKSSIILTSQYRSSFQLILVSDSYEYLTSQYTD